MLGNVSEWVNDWYGDYSAGPQTDPRGPSTGSKRVHRGGGRNAGSNICRASFRNHYAPPGFTFYSLGFRAARTP